ncbi:MAG: Gfo/Idh/MocA family oxidoreductase [Bacteroidota bacterium]
MKTGSSINRRDALKGLSAVTLATMLGHQELKADDVIISEPEILPPFPDTGKPVTCIVLGAGSRGNTYAAYSLQYPERMKIVGVAEPIETRRRTFAQKYNIDPNHVYTTWEHATGAQKFADAIIISTPDQLHHGPAMEGIAKGYDILLEKPISTTWRECREIRDLNRRHNRIIAVCHVLRYTPFYLKMKQIVDSGVLGELVTMEHLEPVGYWHQAHSFVRGNWRNVETSCPMILAKSCHDMDIIRWLVDQPCKTVSSFGSLKHFKSENAPAGSTDRCVDCPVEADCPYSAKKLYLNMKNHGWPVSVITEDTSYEGRMKALREGPYGRCVYRCDNNVVDHQVVGMEFGKDITASFTMSAFTIGSRRTRIMGTMGELTGDSRTINLVNFRNEKKETIDTQAAAMEITSGHGGGDYGLLYAFLVAVQTQDRSMIRSSLEVSVESHLMAFEAERSRLENRTVTLAG